MRLLFILTFLLPFVLTKPALQKTFGIGQEQSVAVSGRLVCLGRPAIRHRIKLYDDDLNSPDDWMNEGLTDVDGNFFLNGTEQEMGAIDPKLNIYHRCNMWDKQPCVLKVTIWIPKDFVSTGPVAVRVFDIGTVQLEYAFSEMSVDCIN